MYFCILFLLIIFSRVGCLTRDDSNEYTVKYELLSGCGGKVICSLNLFMSCESDELQGRACKCHPRRAIQVDFVGYVVGRMCLMLGGLPCQPEGIEGVNVVYNHIKYLEKVKMIQEEILKDDTNTNFTKTKENLVKLYDADENGNSWEDWVKAHIGNYTTELNKYYSEITRIGMYCASGECIGGKCSDGVHPNHTISGKERYPGYSSSNLPYFYLTFAPTMFFLVLNI